MNLHSHVDSQTRPTLFAAMGAVLANSGHEPFGLVGLEPTSDSNLVGGTTELGSSDASRIVLYFRNDQTGPEDWRWKFSENTADAIDFLNGNGQYDEPVDDARIFAASSGAIYIMYRRD